MCINIKREDEIRGKKRARKKKRNKTDGGRKCVRVYVKRTARGARGRTVRQRRRIRDVTAAAGTAEWAVS